MKSVLEPLLMSPELPDYVDSLNRTLAEERQRRERFYDEISEDGKFEFINGRMIMHSPAKLRHIKVSQYLSRLLSTYVAVHKAGEVYAEKALCVFPRNDYVPDIVFFSREKCKGLTGSTLKFPIPDFIVEILSESTEKNDRGVKFQDYSAHGVREYWIVNPNRETIEKYVLKEGRYGRTRSLKAGIISSEVIAGFSIPIRAVFDEKANLASLRQLLGQSR